MLHHGATLVRSSQAELQALDSGHMTQVKTDLLLGTTTPPDMVDETTDHGRHLCL